MEQHPMTEEDKKFFRDIYTDIHSQGIPLWFILLIAGSGFAFGFVFGFTLGFVLSFL